MKLNSISWNIPGAKCCVHENGLTAVVSETDSVYLYKGGNGKPVRMLAFNPKTCQVIYVDENGKEGQYYTDELRQVGELRQMYERGLRLLSDAQYSPLKQEEEKIDNWFAELFARPVIDREELKMGHRLVATIDKDVSNGLTVVECHKIGDFEPSRYGEGRLLPFHTERDSDFDSGICVSKEIHEKNVDLFFVRDVGSVWIDSLKTVELTVEEVKWIRELLPPYSAQRFLNVHTEMSAAAESEKKKRMRKILRAVIHPVANQGAGTVAI